LSSIMNSIFSKAVKRAAGWLCHPAPSFFDLCLAGFLAIPFIKDGYHQEIFFIFYMILLVCVSIGQRPRRDFRSIPLMLLSLWAMLGVFLHSFVISKESITMKYLNMYLMSEGFIYILFSSLFILTVVKYSKNTRLFYLLIPVALFFEIQRPGDFNKTFIFSLGLAIVIYLILIRKYLFASLLANAGLIFACFRWTAIKTSFACRPYVWRQLVAEIAKNPWFGSGFPNTLEHPDHMIWITYGNYGWIWRHNDYLSLAAYLGIFATLFLVWFLIKTVRRIGIRPALIPVLAIVIMSFFQMSMFRIDRAGILLLIGALCIKQGGTE